MSTAEVSPDILDALEILETQQSLVDQDSQEVQYTPTALEEVFGFENEHFRNYVRGDSPELDEAEEISDALFESGHPVARYAAGWVLAEMGMHRSRLRTDGGLPVARRKELLDLAGVRWSAASHDFPQLRADQSDPRIRAQIFALEVKSLEALAYLPTMKIFAGLAAFDPLEQRETRAYQKRTRKQSAEVGRFLTRLSVEGRSMHDIRVGLRSEIACGLVAQAADPMNYVVVPASLRHDHRRESWRRADYWTVEAEKPHRRSFIQVKTAEKPGRRRNYVCHSVVAQRDLTLAPGRSVTNTLDTFSTWSAGKASPDTVGLLRGAANRLMSGIAEHNERTFRGPGRWNRSTRRAPIVDENSGEPEALEA